MTGLWTAISAHLLPIGSCFLWQKGIVWMHALSELVLMFSFAALPIAIILQIRKNPTVSWRNFVPILLVFLLLASATHFFNIWTIWYPHHHLAGIVKILAAGASVFAVYATYPLLQNFIKLRIENAALEKQSKAQKVEQESRGEKISYYASLVESSDDAIFTVTLDGMVTSWNPACEKLYKQSADLMVGESILKVIPKNRMTEIEGYIATIKKGQSIQKCEVEYTNLSGESYFLQMSLSPILNSQQKIIGCSAIIRDITKTKLIEKELEDSIREMQATSKRKDEFLAVLAHELRNPLSSIVMALNLVNEKFVTSDMKDKSIKILKRQISNIVRLVDDLLDASRIQTGKIKMEKRTVDIRGLLQNSVMALESQAQKKRMRLVIQQPEDSVTISGDPGRVEQILTNLIGNAIKYTPEEKRILIKIEKTETTARIIVRDEGIGMTPEFQKKAFNLFVQGEDTYSRAGGGLGIGLSLVKKLVELHGGKTWVESEGLNMGCTFTVELPLSQETEADNEIANGNLPSAAHKQVKILIVDDSRDISSLYEYILTKWGAEVALAENGKEALEQYRKTLPDVTLIDIGLPDKNGIEVMRELKAMNHPSLFVALTGYGGSEFVRKALHEGFDYHLLKPIEPGDLLGFLERNI